MYQSIYLVYTRLLPLAAQVPALGCPWEYHVPTLQVRDPCASGPSGGSWRVPPTGAGYLQRGLQSTQEGLPMARKRGVWVDYTGYRDGTYAFRETKHPSPPPDLLQATHM